MTTTKATLSKGARGSAIGEQPTRDCIHRTLTFEYLKVNNNTRH